MPFSRESYVENLVRSDRKRGTKVATSCTECGKDIVAYASQSPRKYCSRQCRFKAMRIEVLVPCSFCAKPVEIAPHRLKWSTERGRGKIFCNKECQRKGNSGSGSPLWISDRSTLVDAEHSERNTVRLSEWRKAVLDRDGHACCRCGQREGRLQTHHIKEWAYYHEFRYEVGNGETLCKPCHKSDHAARRTNRKVSDEQVAEIRKLRTEGITLKALSELYFVSQGVLSNICSGKKRTAKYVAG